MRAQLSPTGAQWPASNFLFHYKVVESMKSEPGCQDSQPAPPLASCASMGDAPELSVPEFFSSVEQG